MRKKRKRVNGGGCYRYVAKQDIEDKHNYKNVTGQTRF